MKSQDPIIQFILILSPIIIGLFIQLVKPLSTLFSNLFRKISGRMPRSPGRAENQWLALSGTLGSLGVSIILYALYRYNMMNYVIAYVYSILILILSIIYLVISVISYRNREGKRRNVILKELEGIEHFSQENNP